MWQEYYLCIQTQRLGCDISFSEAGGVEIEANWDKVKKVTIPTLNQPDASSLSPLLGGLPLELKDKMVNFIVGCFQAISLPPNSQQGACCSVGEISLRTCRFSDLLRERRTLESRHV